VRVAVVVPVYGNETTLRPLVTRLAAALADHDWSVRLVVDASPEGSAEVARELAADPRVVAQVLSRNVGQHRALAAGLAAADGAEAWVCLDADLQDPPEAVPDLLARLAPGDVAAVFAGRRGSYEGPLRLLTGRAHRALMARLTGLPADAGAFLALDTQAREAVLRLQGPSLVAAIGAARLPANSVPVERAARETGRSAWTTRARLRQSARTLAWTLRHRRR
jgi:glycosyltransferase involved in cell wall biosynthesis